MQSSPEAIEIKRRLEVVKKHLSPGSINNESNNHIQQSSVNYKPYVRLLQPDDYEKGFLSILSQLTTIGNITKEQYLKRFNELFNNELPDYYICVIEDNGTIIGSSTLLIERKFVHECGYVGHIEDVVVDSRYRGYNLGKLLIDECINYSKKRNCYKVILDCSEKNVGFYEKCGFIRKEIQMRLDL
ncbi:hypothetical protein ABK040_008816 [Willaertia magna]